MPDRDNPRLWRIRDDWSNGDLDHGRYVIVDGEGTTRATGLRWKDATRILRALRQEDRRAAR